MKKILVTLLIAAAFVSCAKSNIDEDVYGQIRTVIFEEIAVKGIDHKLSGEEKKLIMADILKKYKIDVNLYTAFMKNGHSEDYNYIFGN